MFFFSIWVFFHNHSRITRLQSKGKGISLTRHYHFHLLHRHLDISWAITAESLPLHIGSSWTRTGIFWFLSASRSVGKMKIIFVYMQGPHIKGKNISNISFKIISQLIISKRSYLCYLRYLTCLFRLRKKQIIFIYKFEEKNRGKSFCFSRHIYRLQFICLQYLWRTLQYMWKTRLWNIWNIQSQWVCLLGNIYNIPSQWKLCEQTNNIRDIYLASVEVAIVWQIMASPKVCRLFWINFYQETQSRNLF